MSVLITGSPNTLTKFEKISYVALIMAFLGMFWALSPFVLPQQEKKEVGQVVVDIAKSMLKAVKGNKSQEPLLLDQTFLEKVVERTQNLLNSSIKLNEYQLAFQVCRIVEGESRFGWNQEILRLYVF